MNAIKNVILSSTEAADAVPLLPLTDDGFAAWKDAQPEPRRRWLDATGFQAKPDHFALLPDADGALAAVVAGVADDADRVWSLAAMADKLPPGRYRLDADGWDAARIEAAALGWGLAGYRYDRYSNAGREPARLVLPDGCRRDELDRLLDAVALVRDLINTPAEDMMPQHLAEVAAGLAERAGATLRQSVGEALLDDGYPTVHAVGRASAHAPRLLDLRWSPAGTAAAGLPRLTLIGKGVCFDSGGLDIKPAAGMRLMKKDMGGAAHALALAQLVIDAALPVRLRLLIPAVENAIAGNAFRPGDVLRTRAGLSVEVDNTDAEGRLILCDALAAAADEKPALLVDFATLTGAARVALGTELPALFSNDEATAGALQRHGAQTGDPVWPMPLHPPYKNLLDSKIADLVNAPSGPFGGAITAALFLQAFVPDAVPWVHYDIMAWNVRALPGRPVGGEAMGLRASYAYLRERFAV